VQNLCGSGYTNSPYCDQCAPGYYGFPNCQKCLCSSIGSKNEKCDKTTGQCSCKVGFTSTNCEECATGFTGNTCNTCLSGYDRYGYPDCSKGALILVATGSFKDHAQVVDMNSNNTCTNLKEYPIRMLFASGGVVGGSPTICGGYGDDLYSSDENRKECYAYHKSSNAWKLHANMESKRKFHSSVVMNGALWVLGGADIFPNLQSTEYIYANGTVVAGPNLPSGRFGNCPVTLHDGKVMIIGGFSSDPLNTMLIFNPNNNSFIQGPSMIHERYYFACTLFYSPMHDNRPVVLSAGGEGQATAEVLDYTTANAVWEQIGALPKTYDTTFPGANALPSYSNNGAYLQFKKYFYELVCSTNSCTWTIMKKQLTHPVSYATVMYLPYDYTCQDNERLPTPLW